MTDHPQHPDPHERRLWAEFSAAQAGRHEACPAPLDLAAYIDGRAEPGLAERIERHLADCDACLQAIVDARQLAAAGTVAFVPPNAIEAAKALVRPAVKVGTPGLRTVARWAAGVAVAAALGYGGFAAGEKTQHGRQAVEAAVVAEASFGLPVTPADDEELDEWLLAGGVQ